MTVPGSGEARGQSEQLVLVKRFSMQEHSSRLGNKQDAVCDGQHVKLSSLEQPRTDGLKGDAAKKKNADELAARFPQPIKIQDHIASLLSKQPTAESILRLDQELALLTNPDSGPFAGLLVNIQESSNPDAASIGMIAFIDYLSAHQSDQTSQAEILNGAYGAVSKVYVSLGSKEEPVFAATLISKKGEMAIRVTNGMSVTVVDKAKKGTYFGMASGVTTRTVKEGEQIILCSKAAAAEIKGDGKKVGEIVEDLTKIEATSDTIETVSSQKIRAPRENDNSPSKPEDRIFQKKDWFAVIDGVGSQGGEAAAIAIHATLSSLVEGTPIKTKDSAGGDILYQLPENLDGKSETDVFVEMTRLGQNLNRIVREKTSGGAACFSIARPYTDDKGIRRVAYVNVGDTEFIVVKKDGSVVLTDNDSIRCLAEKHKSVDHYLKNREAAWKYAAGERTDKLTTNAGSLQMSEGDKFILMSDGAGEDLQNIRRDKGPDGHTIGVDILGEIKDKSAKESTDAIFKLLDEVRMTPGREVIYVSDEYKNKDGSGVQMKRKRVDRKGLDIVVGGKGPTQDRGWDDSESVLVFEAKHSSKKNATANAAAGGAVHSESILPTATPEITPKPAALDSAPIDQEAEGTIEAALHAPPFWADKQNEQVSANKYVKSLFVRTNLSKAQLHSQGINVDEPQPSYVMLTPPNSEGKYNVSINIFQANRVWVHGAMDALKGSSATNLPLAEQKVLLQQIHDLLSWEQENDTNPLRAKILAAPHPLNKLFTHSTTADQIMTVEVMIRQLDHPPLTKEELAQAKKDQRKALVEGLRARLGEEPGVAAKSTVDHKGEYISEEGDFQALCIEGKVNEIVRRDMAAADLMIDVVSDLPVNVAELAPYGIVATEGATYRQVREQLREATKLTKESRSTVERAQAQRIYNQFRRIFYEHVYEALGGGGTLTTRDVLGKPIYDKIASFNPVTQLQQAKDIYLRRIEDQYHAQEQLESALINHKHYEGGKKPGYVRPKAFDDLEPTSVADMALKGLEMYIRLIKDPINLTIEFKPPEPDLGIIYNKQFIQSEAEALLYLGDPKAKAVQNHGQEQGTQTPNGGGPPGVDSIPIDSTEPDDGVGLGAAHAELEAAPVDEGETIPGRKPGLPGAAPLAEPTEEPIPSTPLPTSAILGAGLVTNAGAQNILQLADHVGATDIARMKPKRRIYNIPIFGGILYSIRHPIKLIWQQNLAASVFEQQRVRFTADFRTIVKGATDQSVPIDVSPQLIDLALEEGRNIRKNQNFLRRGVWAASDYVKGITGLFQTSEMILAKQWLRNEMVGKTPNQWQDKLKAVTSSILSEQTNLGERFALKPEGWTLDQANSHALTYEGETRHSLMDNIRGRAEGEEAKAVNQQLRSFVEAYSTGSFTQEQLVTAVNTYLKSEAFRNLLPDAEKKIMDYAEIATNIVNIAEGVKGRWTEYSEGRAFDTFTFDILYGKAEWGGVRAHKETSFLTEMLARRLSERKFVEGAVGGYTLSLVNDVITYGGAFAAGWGVSTLNSVFNKIPSAILIGGLGPVGGVFGMGAMATLKETGISIPGLKNIRWNWGGHEFHPFAYIGRTAKDAGQASREAARGALQGAAGTIRSEMERTLVNRKEAPTLSSTVEAMLKNTPEEMTEPEAMKLLATLADIDARMRLSDLSGTKHMNYHTQNYIGFTGGQENEQYLALKKALLDGIVQLQAFETTHPTFTKGHGVVFTGVRLKYGASGQELGLFEKMSALAEAQLRVSSEVSVVSQWMKRELQMTQPEAQALMTDFFAAQKSESNTAQSESLKTKEWNLKKLTIKRGGATLLKSVLAAPVAGMIYSGIGNVVQTGMSEFGEIQAEGIQQWGADWGKVLLKGDVPLVTDSSGTLVADLTPLQQGYIYARNIIEPPVEFSGLHDTNIDEISIQLPGHLRYTNDGAGHDYIMNLRNGSVAMDMSNVEIHGQLVNGQSEMIYTDNNGAPIAGSPVTDFNSLGVYIKSAPPIEGVQEATIWTPSTTTHAQIIESGHQVIIPENTVLVHDDTTNAWDLKALDTSGNVQTAGVDGHEITLMQDVQFGTDGKIVSIAEVHSGVSYTDEAMSGGGGGMQIESREVIGTNGRWDEASGRYGFTFGHGSEHAMQDFKETNVNGDAVYIAHAGGGTTTTPDGTTYSIADAAANHQLGFAIQIPGHGTFVVPPNDGITNLRLDPADTHIFTLSDGSEMTYGELAKMVINQKELQAQPDGFLGTEINHHTNVLSLKPEGRAWGSISSIIVPHGTIDDPQNYTYNGPSVNTNGMITEAGQEMDGSVIAFAAVRGTAPAGASHIEIPVGSPSQMVYTPTITACTIPDEVHTFSPAFSSTADSSMTYRLDIPLLPFPIGRENIEKAEYGSSDRSVTPPSTIQGTVTTPAAQQPTVSTTSSSTLETRIPALSPEKMAEEVTYSLTKEDREKKNGPYQALLFPALAAYEVAIESKNVTEIERTRAIVVAALKTCDVEGDATAAAQKIEAKIVAEQNVDNSEYKAAQAEKKKIGDASKKEADRAAKLMKLLEVSITPNERKTDTKKLQKFERIMAIMKEYIAATDSNDPAGIAASRKKLLDLTRNEWNMVQSKRIAAIDKLATQIGIDKDVAAQRAAAGIQEPSVAAAVPAASIPDSDRDTEGVSEGGEA